MWLFLGKNDNSLGNPACADDPDAWELLPASDPDAKAKERQAIDICLTQCPINTPPRFNCAILCAKALGVLPSFQLWVWLTDPRGGREMAVERRSPMVWCDRMGRIRVVLSDLLLGLTDSFLPLWIFVPRLLRFQLLVRPMPITRAADAVLLGADGEAADRTGGPEVLAAVAVDVNAHPASLSLPPPTPGRPALT